VCQGRSEKVHSHYVRLLADLPWMGCAVRLEWHVRRFFCTNKECARRIFDLPSSQRSGSLRSTPRRLTELFTLIGFALAGEAGKQLVEAMGEHTSPDTLLRLIRKAPEATSSTPRVLGVDDFSFRRGRIFGTILVDLEKRVPIDPRRPIAKLTPWKNGCKLTGE
jgi:transposase